MLDKMLGSVMLAAEPSDRQHGSHIRLDRYMNARFSDGPLKHRAGTTFSSGRTSLEVPGVPGTFMGLTESLFQERCFQSIWKVYSAALVPRVTLQLHSPME